MMLVYILTTIITATWLIRMIQEKKFIFQRTPLDIPILLFLLSQIISTLLSIDVHTSLWGYYSRFNGGLVSIISYILLYYALLSNFGTREYVLKFLKVSFISGLIAAAWAIPEHFGVDPSCVLLKGEVNASCWQQDVQARVFSTLGQPNWLAAYLGMLIFPAISFALAAKTKLKAISYYLLTIIYYLAFTFTYSRGGMIGLLAGLIVCVVLYVLSSWKTKDTIFFASLRMTNKKPQRVAGTGGPPTSAHRRVKRVEDIGWGKGPTGPVVVLSLIVASFIIINLLFASALTSFQLIKKSAAPPRPGITSGGTTQLESGGTESGQIRLIVWKGALEIFKHYPLFGSGVETFAYSYYNFRPVSHNLVSEWNFLYNKAHNEYLNYLATTGLIGLGTYLLLIATFISWSISRIMNNESRKKGKTIIHHSSFIILPLLASYVTYLVQNITSFSVVIIALFFYLFPALTFASLEKIPEGFWFFKPLYLPKKVVSFSQNLSQRVIYQRSIYTQLTIAILILGATYFSITLIRNWQADTHFALGQSYVDSGNPGRGYNELLDAISENPREPFYRSELGLAAASAAVALQNSDATLSAQLKQTSIFDTQKALSISPKNVSYWRKAVQTYYQLSTIDPIFIQKTLDALNESSQLAPTDPSLLYNRALVLAQNNRVPEAIEVLKQAMVLKPDYHDAGVTLSDLYDSAGQKDQAISELQTILKYFPNDPEATQKLNTLEGK